MEKQVTIAEYSSWSSAQIARGKLESEGIPCVLLNTAMNSLYGGSFTTIVIRVPEEAAPHAMAILADIDLGDGPMYL
ncbi:putative signal transducing protein [Phaeocystidibacter marisrubri]|uniref:putative signal transducing protein n=1 Tax=Phaeocystidibacter marisrubri TaxID=1577780 RepID=UPI0014786592|nr:DUF2007 domain-containing protein [Phaeocystidibacter marisrubri]